MSQSYDAQQLPLIGEGTMPLLDSHHEDLSAHDCARRDKTITERPPPLSRSIVARLPRFCHATRGVNGTRPNSATRCKSSQHTSMIYEFVRLRYQRSQADTATWLARGTALSRHHYRLSCGKEDQFKLITGLLRCAETTKLRQRDSGALRPENDTKQLRGNLATSEASYASLQGRI